MYNFNQQQQYNAMPGAFPQPGNVYGQVPQPKFTNPLSAQRIAELRNKGAAFSLAITQDDIDRAVCTHRDPQNNQNTLLNNGDGTYTCNICGATFEPVDADQENIEKAIRLAVDILQTTKTMYYDIPEGVCKDYFQIIPLLEKAPKLFKIAAENVRKYEGGNSIQNTGMNGFNLFGMLTGPGMYAPQGMYQQPMYPQQQQMYQQPVYQQQAAPGYPQQMGGNPFVQQQPIYQQQPTCQPQTQVEQQPQQPNPQQVEQTKVFRT